MTLYNPESTIRAARERYFEINHFEGGGYEEGWVKMKAGPVPIWFPNTVARVKAVKFHDIHHVLTEYPTTWKGEAEIGAWEVSTGCGAHYQAWLLNLSAFAIGLVINPRGVYRAFVRGRQSRNLFAREWDERFLSRTVGEVRRSLGLDVKMRRATARDNVAFAAWSLVSVAVYLITLPLLIVPLFVVTLPLRLTREREPKPSGG